MLFLPLSLQEIFEDIEFLFFSKTCQQFIEYPSPIVVSIRTEVSGNHLLTESRILSSVITLSLILALGISIKLFGKMTSISTRFLPEDYEITFT